MCEADAPKQILKARVRADGIEYRFDVQKWEKAGAFFKGFFEFFKSVVNLAQAEMNGCKVIR